MNNNNIEHRYLPDAELHHFMTEPVGTAQLQLVWRTLFRSLDALNPNYSTEYINDFWKAEDTPLPTLLAVRTLICAASYLVYKDRELLKGFSHLNTSLHDLKEVSPEQRNVVNAIRFFSDCFVENKRRLLESATKSLECAGKTDCAGTDPNYLFFDFDYYVSHTDAIDGLTDTIYDRDHFEDDDGFLPLETTSVTEAFYQSRPTWSFWREWYQGFLDGKPLDWELQRRVALIPDEDWEQGPEHIARKIEEIQAEWLSEQAPSAEKIEFDEATQKFHVIPLEIAKPDLLGATLSQIEDALDDVLACPSNGLHDGSKAVRVLRRTLTKYGNNPQQIEMGLVTAHTAITRQFLADEMPQSEENLALRDAIEDGARGIRATHPEVAENRKILQDQALREMSSEDLDLLEDAKPLLEAWSSDDLAEGWAHDIPQLINDATTPLPSGAPPLPGAEEATRIFSRAAKMKLSYDAIVSKGASAFDSKAMKTVRLGLTLGGVLSALVGMGLRVFGLI